VAAVANAPVATDLEWALNVGQVGELGHKDGGMTTVWLCLDETWWDAMLDAQKEAANGGADAGASLYSLANTGKIKVYAAGTKVRLLKSSAFSRQVEVLDGDDKGDVGWVQNENVVSL
jgi:hypothetical protein